MVLPINSYLYPQKILCEIKSFCVNKPLAKRKDDLPKIIFLCGKKLEKNNDGNRELVSDLYKKLRPDIITMYSENLCEIFDLETVDLLSFEELLAEASDGIILFVESFGTICELGAFAMKENLIKKLLIINDKKQEREVSFINNGPIRKVMRRNKCSVMYTNLNALFGNPNMFSKLIDFIPKNIKFEINIIEKEVKLNSFIYELLELINLLGPINKKDLINIYKYIKDFKSFTYFSNQQNTTINKIKVTQIIDLLAKMNLVFVDENNNINIFNNLNFNYKNIMLKIPENKFNEIRMNILCRKFRYKSILPLKDVSSI